MITSGIYAPASEDAALWQAVQSLRAQGERVVCGVSSDTPDFSEINCDRQLVLIDGEYIVQDL